MAANSLNINNAWNAVSLEERVELISRCQAVGIIAAFVVFLFVGAIAYGFDQIWLLLGGVALALMAMPAFANYSWRREKPALILSYLAVRSVARRYAYGYALPDLNIVLIFRGRITRVFKSKEEEELFKQNQDVDFDTSHSADLSKDVWIVLVRGGVIALSEQRGGAKLEYVTAISPHLIVKEPKKDLGFSENAIAIEGIGTMIGRNVILESKYPGSLYVFQRKLERLLEESKQTKPRLSAQWQPAQITA